MGGCSGTVPVNEWELFGGAGLVTAQPHFADPETEVQRQGGDRSQLGGQDGRRSVPAQNGQRWPDAPCGWGGACMELVAALPTAQRWTHAHPGLSSPCPPVFLPCVLSLPHIPSSLGALRPGASSWSQVPAPTGRAETSRGKDHKVADWREEEAPARVAPH